MRKRKEKKDIKVNIISGSGPFFGLNQIIKNIADYHDYQSNIFIKWHIIITGVIFNKYSY